MSDTATRVEMRKGETHLEHLGIVPGSNVARSFLRLGVGCAERDGWASQRTFTEGEGG